MKPTKSLFLPLIALAALLVLGSLGSAKDNATQDASLFDKKGEDSPKTQPDKGLRGVSKDDGPLFDKTTKAKKEDPNAAREAKKEFAVHPDLIDAYAELARVVELDDKGQEQLLKLQEMKAEALNAFDDKYDKAIIKIENAKERTNSEKKREKYNNMLKEVGVRRRQLEQKYDNQSFRVLNQDQLVAWNSYELWTVLSPEFEFDDVDMQLTEQQLEKAKAICQTVAQKIRRKRRIGLDLQVQRMTRTQIGRTVLTEEQRSAYLRQMKRRKHREMKEEREQRRGRYTNG